MWGVRGCSPSRDYRFLSRSLLHLGLLASSLHPSSDSQDFPKALPVPLFRVGSMCMWGVTLPETLQILKGEVGQEKCAPQRRKGAEIGKMTDPWNEPSPQKMPRCSKACRVPGDWALGSFPVKSPCSRSGIWGFHIGKWSEGPSRLPSKQLCKGLQG